MFRKKEDTKEIDIKSLNIILKTGKKLVNVFYFMIIIALILLATYICKEWKILNFIGEFLGVISPIFIGFFIAWLLAPSVKNLEDKKVPRTLACIIVYLILIIFLGFMVYLIIPTMASQISDFARSLPDLMKSLTNTLEDVLEGLSNKFNLNTKVIENQMYSYITNITKDLSTNLPTTLFSIGKSIISGGVSFVLGLMIGFYMLFDFDKLSSGIEKFVPITWRDNYLELIDRINNSLRSYLQGVLIIMFLVFVTQSIGLTLAGLKAPLIFALFCAVTDIIPYFGPYIGAIPAIIVGFTISPLTGISVIIAIIVVQTLENNFYQPLIMGKTMELHPVTIMIGLLLFEHFFGILGMVIATPAIACLKVILLFINEKIHLLDKMTGEDDKPKEKTKDIKFIDIE